MTAYAVGYRIGGKGEPAHAVPIIDGVAVSGPPPVEAEPRACTETTKAGEPCKGTPGDDGLCAAHKKAADSGDSK
jgi:hypothetical protein